MAQTPANPTDHDGENAQTDTLAPENENSEQLDGDAQAQTVTEDALTRATSVLGTDSVHVPSAPGEPDAQDLVDHMKQMDRSGTIDMSAYAGEPSHDDEPDTYGKPGDGDDAVEDLPGDVSE